MAPEARRRRRLSVLGLLLLGSIWGGTYSISKLAMEGGIPPLAYAFWQCAGSGLLLVALLRLRGEGLPGLGGAAGRRAWAYGLGAGILGSMAPNLAFYYAIPHLPAGLMVVVITTSPLVTYLGALALSLERSSARRIAGLLLGFCGCLILLAPGAALPDAEAWGWLLLGFLTPLFYGCNALFAARFRPPEVSSLQLAAMMLLAAGAVGGPLLLAIEGGWWPSPPYGPPELALLVQVLATCVAYLIYFELLRWNGAVFVSQVGYVVTLTGLLWGVIFFGERPTLGLGLAAAAILSGLWLVNRGGRRTGTTATGPDR